MPGRILPTWPLTRMTWRRERILDVYNFMLALVLAASPWLFHFSRTVTRADALISGVAVVLLSLLALVAFAEWQEWANIVVGGWIAVSPFVLGFTHTHAMHIAIAIGLLVAYDAAIELWVIRSHYSPGST